MLNVECSISLHQSSLLRTEVVSRKHLSRHLGKATDGILPQLSRARFTTIVQRKVDDTSGSRLMNIRWSVLVAEDNENDVLILRHVFSKISTDVSLAFVNDGEEAIKYLRGENGFSDRSKHPFPDVLLLDLKMPRLDGF